MHIDLERLVELDRRATDAELAVVRKVTREDLDRPTPCAEWTLRDLLAHMTAQHHGFAAAARGKGADEERWRVHPLEGDPVLTHAAGVTNVAAAFAAATEDSRFALPEFGHEEFPPAQAMSFHLVDSIAHGWDVARTLDLPFDLDGEVLDAGWQVASTIPDGELRLQPGSPFAPIVAVAETESPLDRILGALGRSPSWSPAAVEHERDGDR